MNKSRKYCQYNQRTVWYDDFGDRHRDDAPAIIWDSGVEEYYHHGMKHRVDGPAEIWPDGSVGYWINGCVPTTFRDMVFLKKPLMINFEMFPSADYLPMVNHWTRNVYRIHDPDELVLAILRYG